MANEKNLYVELELRAIKDGRVWSGPHKLTHPTMTENAYTELEIALMSVYEIFGRNAQKRNEDSGSAPAPKRG